MIQSSKLSSYCNLICVLTGPPNHLVIELQLLRTQREITQTEMESLELEKRAIKATLLKVMFELQQSRESLEQKYKDLQIYDNAIKEIEYIYGHILFSPEIFNQT
jgi:hypothetical protein